MSRTDPCGVLCLSVLHVQFVFVLGTLCDMWDLSSPTRDPTCVPYIARQGLSWTAREVPEFFCLFLPELKIAFWFTCLVFSKLSLTPPYDLPSHLNL